MLQKMAKVPFGPQKTFDACKINAYMEDIFKLAKPADGAICVMSAPKDEKKNVSFIRASYAGENMAKEVSRHDYRDLFFTFATYKEVRDTVDDNGNKITNTKRNLKNISNMFAWGVDIDFKNAALNPEYVYEYLLSCVNIPAPNYIEFGNRLRLVYIFSEPLRFFPKQKHALIEGFRFMQKAMCRKINNAVDDMGAEPMSATAFFRVPGSQNSKGKKTVNIRHISDEQYSMQEIFDDWILKEESDPSGNRDEWYDSWKAKKDNPDRKLVKTFNSMMLWKRRVAVFEELRAHKDIPREKLCFLMGVGLLHLNPGMSQEDAISKVLLFNQGFSRPLSEHEIRSKLRTIKKYKYKDESIADMLCVDRSYFAGKNKKERDRERYEVARKKQFERGETKTQKIEKRRIDILNLYYSYSLSEIADRLHISLSTVKKDVRYMKEIGMIIVFDNTSYRESGLSDEEIEMARQFEQKLKMDMYNEIDEQIMQFEEAFGESTNDTGQTEKEKKKQKEKEILNSPYTAYNYYLERKAVVA